MAEHWKELIKALWYLEHQRWVLMVIFIKSNRISNVNQGPAKGNAVCKGNHDLMGKMEEACDMSYARPWRCRGCLRYSQVQ